MTKFIKCWCGSNTALAKCTRTIFQGVIGVIIAYSADIVAGFGLAPTECAIITALVMAILSPIQAAFGDMNTPDEEWEVEE